MNMYIFIIANPPKMLEGIMSARNDEQAIKKDMTANATRKRMRNLCFAAAKTVKNALAPKANLPICDKAPILSEIKTETP
jgi:hypothetical protein